MRADDIRCSLDAADSEIEELRQELAEAKITLRDSFAMRALTGILIGPTIKEGKDACASNAYEYADAMIEERKKG